jgi:regulator of nucleoside diphosphate kinase
MTRPNELLISTSDAEILAFILSARGGSDRSESDAATALSDLLVDARLVPHEHLPVDRVAMNSCVTYCEAPGGVTRMVVVVPPNEADAASGRISVLSPVARALLGRRRGSTVRVERPDGRTMTARILNVEKCIEAFLYHAKDA